MQAAGDDDDQSLDGVGAESAAKQWLKPALIALVIVGVLAAIGFGLSKLMSGGLPEKRQVTKIKLIPDVPPPPPPPPPKEQPKEQPKQEQPKEIKVEQPKPAEAPPAENLKMEGPAGDGPSPFQAGAVKDDYKGGDVKTIGSDGGEKFNWYAGLLKNQIENALARDKKLTDGQYKLVISVWLKSNGDIERLELNQSDAEGDVEQTLRNALNGMRPVSEPPPEGMPQPIKLRVTARKVG